MIFDHVGLFVADLETGRNHLERLLKVTRVEREIDDSGLKVRIQFLVDRAGIRYELIAPFGEGNPVSGVLESGKAILNHLAYRVENIDKEARRMRDEGSLPLGPARPAIAFGGRRVMFFLTPLRFVVELIEDSSESERMV